MSSTDLQQLLPSLIARWEGECVEFKEATDGFSTSDIGKYFAALANEANLRGLPSGWLVFGVSNRRQIVGTTYRPETARLQSLKHQIAQDTDPNTSFREIHELLTPEGHRVVLFEIPAAPRGIPIAWKGHFFARDGESLTALSLAKQDEIRAQSLGDDWSASFCPQATLIDLDLAALAKAREVFISKYGERIPEATIRAWDDMTFLEKAALSAGGKIKAEGNTSAGVWCLTPPQVSE